MKAGESARRVILAQVRLAAPRAASVRSDVAREYVQAGKLGLRERLALLTERLLEYDAQVTECSPAEIPQAIALQLAASGRRVFVAPAGLPGDWLVQGFDWRIDAEAGRALAIDDIENADGVMTAAFCAVADSATIALHHSAAEGRRVLTLLPDWHLCILRASQVVETLPEYFSRCRDMTPRLATWISGPSATADIEMTRIKGVHGPRFLQVILVRDDA